MTDPADLDLGVYVHLPFCSRVCPYCDFAVEAVGSAGSSFQDLERRYVELLLRELERLRVRFASELEGRRLATLYFGGGTPSRVSPRGLERLIAGVRSAFPGEPEEVTLEVNPGDEDTDRARQWRALGVDRVSLGVQALDDASLKRLGRAHSGRQALAGLERCLSAGFASVSVDLIYGVPDQSEDVLLRTVARVVELGVPHVSTYALTLEPGTPFARAAERGQLPLPSSGQVRRQGNQVRAVLSAAGLRPYEISSSARPGHAAHHNRRYWMRRPVLGLGVSAATLLGELRFQNPRDRGSWEAALARGELPLGDVEPLTEREARRETLALGFRLLSGVSRTAYRRRFESTPERDFGPELDELSDLELLATRGDRLHLTQRGVTFADEVFLRFVGR